MVILRTRNKITDFFMILAWASPFNLLTATGQSEIKSNDPWYKPYDDSVIPRYIIYDKLVTPWYMMILLYPAIYLTILLYCNK